MFQIGENMVELAAGESYNELPNILFHRNGSVCTGNLVRDTVLKVNGREIPCECYRKGRLEIFGGDIESYTSDVDFYDNGMLASAKLFREIKYPLPNRPNCLIKLSASYVYFYPDGRLKSCYLKEPEISYGIHLKNDGYLEWDKDGNLKK